MAQHGAEEQRGDVPRISGKNGPDGLRGLALRCHAQTLAKTADWIRRRQCPISARKSLPVLKG
ncbi:hypothetical protein GCM10017710_29680 [Arthrobacter ramosus]